MIPFGSLKTELINTLVNQDIGTRVGDWVQWVLADIYSEAEYFWNRKSDTITTVSGTAEYFLDRRAGVVQDIMFNETDNTHINKIDQMSIFQADPTPTDTGSPAWWALMDTNAVQNTTASASTVTVVSSDTTDLSQKAQVRGKVSGVNRTEEIDLNGTTNATGSLSFDAGSIEACTLSATCAGTVTFTADSTTISSIPPGELFVYAKKVRLWHVPGSALTIRYFYYQEALKPFDDNQLIDIPTAAFKALRRGLLVLGHQNNGDEDLAALNEVRYEKDKKDLYRWSQRNSRVNELKTYQPSTGLKFRLPDVVNGTVTA